MKDIKETAKKFKELTGFEMDLNDNDAGIVRISMNVTQNARFNLVLRGRGYPRTEEEIFQAWNDFVKSLKPIEK